MPRCTKVGALAIASYVFWSSGSVGRAPSVGNIHRFLAYFLKVLGSPGELVSSSSIEVSSDGSGNSIVCPFGDLNIWLPFPVSLASRRRDSSSPAPRAERLMAILIGLLMGPANAEWLSYCTTLESSGCSLCPLSASVILALTVIARLGIA